MNCKLLCLEVMAIVCSYLIFSLSIASAANVKIYYNGVYQSPSVQYNPQLIVSREITVNPSSLVAKISVTNATQTSQIEKTYVYKCRGLAPKDCASETPDVSEGPFNSEYQWSALADRTSGYPQNANILIIVKASVSGKAFWSGFWHRIERTGLSSFSQYEYQIDEIQVHAKDLDDVSAIRNFITSNRIIPFNPKQVVKIVFPVASGGLYLIESGLTGIESGLLSANETSQNNIAGIEQDYVFAFSKAEGGIFSPVTLNLNPDYTCGNVNCEDSLGESQANCCMDCGCSGGYYCDSSGSCKQSSGISLSLYGTPNTAVSNCNQQHTLSIPVKINNPPSGIAVTSMRYRLGSGSYQTFVCSGGQNTGYVYSCPVVVPPVPNCVVGTYRVGPNYINFSITYPDGNSTVSKSVSTSFPEITIGSYTCGNLNCESSLGESQANCCYDCGCASGYCDFTAPDNCSCKQDLSSSNLRIISQSPFQFYTHTSGDSVSFLAQITNSPSTLSVQEYLCSLKCSRSDGQACSSSCSISCSKKGSSDPSVYNSTCTMGFSVQDYDTLKSYNLFPALNLSVRYSNGSYNTIQKTLSSAFSTISIGAHWCGDKKCDPDETQASCCYDCTCPEGQYCDTQNMEYYSQGDSCKETPRIEIDSMGTTAFTSSYEQHIINVTGHASSRPGGVGIVPLCVFNSTLSGVPCYVSCQEENTSGSLLYRFSCSVAVPFIDYNASYFYNPAARRIAIRSNSLNITLSYNNGPSRGGHEFSFPIPEVVINVIPRCGDSYGEPDVCERSIGEDGRLCCVDCGCNQEYGSDYFCYTGSNPSGECLSTSSINMRIREIIPNPVNCTIQEKGGKCLFANAMRVYPAVINPPSDLDVLEAYYRIGNTGNFTPFNCYKTGEGQGNFSCSFIPETPRQTTEGTETRTIEVKMSLGFTLNGALAVQNVSDSSGFKIERTYSEALASCLEDQARIEKKLAKLEGDKTLYTILAILFFIISVVYLVLFFTTCLRYGNCDWYYQILGGVAGVVGGCGLAYALSRLDSIDSEIKNLKSQKKDICESSTFGALSRGTSSINWFYTIGQIYGTIVCMMGVSSILSGVSSALSSTNTASNLPQTGKSAAPQGSEAVTSTISVP